MPVKKKVETKSVEPKLKPSKVIESDSESEDEVQIARVNSVPKVISKPSVYLTNTNLKSSIHKTIKKL